MQRFWNKVRKLPGVDSCWIWTAGKDRYGYGQFKLDGKVKRAHQVSWKIHKGKFSPYLCHTCDNRACVNPCHLYEGDHVRNNRDQKDRGKGWSVKYTDHIIRRVRRLYAIGISSTHISRDMKIPKATVMNIIDGKTRKHAGGPMRIRGTRRHGNRFKNSQNLNARSVS